MDDRNPPGYDDWFDDPEPPTLEAGRGGRQSYDAPHETEEDVWVLPEDAPRRSRRGQRGDITIGGRGLTTTQIAIIVIAALAIIIAIIAAAGGFSSSPAAGPPTTITTQTTLPTTATTPTTPTVKAPTQQLKQGDTGPQVKLLQKALIALNFLNPPNTADGSFGPATKIAVENFQSANSLNPIDGIVGKDTLAALKQQLGG